MDLLTVVIPVHGLWDYTAACLKSLAASLSGDFFRVVVADNASTDETGTACGPLGRELFGERFSHLWLARNEGFARACNAGADGSASRYLLFLNNDTICAGNWLPPLLKAMEGEKGVGAVSPLLIFPEDGPGGAPADGGRFEAGRVQHAGVCVDPNLHPVHVWSLFPPGHPAVGRRRTLQALSAAALLLPGGLFRELGGFWPGFVNGGEDMDLSCRLRRAGYKLRLAPDSVIEHHTSMTPGRFDHAAANSRLLNERCQGCFAPDLQRVWRSEGYEMRLSAWLEPYAVLPAAVAPEWRDDPAEAVAREPLWEAGYGLAAKRASERGEAGEVCRLLGLRAGLFPSKEHFAAALAGSLAAGNAAEERRWRLRLAQAEAMLARSGELLERARGVIGWARGAGEAQTVQLYGEWLRARTGGGDG
ncbi:glycosyl transferase family 2 [Desulfovibrio sp. X2]|uniref:glycosyltransferase family 2 protein n=1 Tax=Desulfovibrio sp. X2 TaxID=941449 RepID=UPI000358C103|nr:glycosyltransferase family 2 protein [Desulfovibrio sp. X2]EPR41936.1 glycosyl transferase family 2 [Desulfovibrio sp. X2]